MEEDTWGKIIFVKFVTYGDFSYFTVATVGSLSLFVGFL